MSDYSFHKSDGPSKWDRRRWAEERRKEDAELIAPFKAKIAELEPLQLTPDEADAIIVALQRKGAVSLHYIHARERLKAISASRTPAEAEPDATQ